MVSFLENETYKILRDFEIQTDHLISARRPALVIIKIKKKRTCRIVDFAVPTDHRRQVKREISSRVTYWPSTEPSIRRCTCVNKRKNSGRCRSENQRQTEGFGPSVTHGWATPAKMRKKCCYGQKNFGSICSSLSPSPTHLSHTTNINPFENKVCEIIFL